MEKVVKGLLGRRSSGDVADLDAIRSQSTESFTAHAATSSGSTRKMTLLRQGSSSWGLRGVCKHGTKCYRRNPDHLDAEAHPADPDYLKCCRAAGARPEFVSIRKLFEWCDVNDLGKASRDEITKNWSLIQDLGKDIPEMTSSVWQSIDDDGNGWLNFSEFADYCTEHGVGLPLGLDELLGTKHEANLRCGVIDCHCLNFEMRRARCKYGAGCYQKKADHLSRFAHPDDSDWEADFKSGDSSMCRCGHKRSLHSCALLGAEAVEYPDDWKLPPFHKSEFCDLVHLGSDHLIRFQELLNASYSDVTTRDRANHNAGNWMVPRSFTVKAVMRNENSKLWRKYTIKKAELRQVRKLTLENDAAEWTLYDDVLTTNKWESLGSDTLDILINEWYLFHGTSLSSALEICSNDFKMSLAGKATGTLYGRGSYFAESITKADEYSKNEGDGHCVLLCRVLGGRVRYTDEKTPDPEALTRDCLEGDCDCIIGDRKKASGTYREFIVFDTEDVYPEYILTYDRGPFFKSPSHP